MSLTLQVTIHAVRNKTVYGILLAIALPGCAIKQLVNLVQVKPFPHLLVTFFLTSMKFSGCRGQKLAQEICSS
jgi:hypothetical protein